MRACCLTFVTVMMVPLGIIIAAFLEKPQVLRLAEPEKASVDEGGARMSATVVDSVTHDALGTGRMFDRIASKYDAVNKYMSLGLDQRWREHLVTQCIRPRPNDQVLDLATGTADVGLLVARHLQASGSPGEASVLGIDPSQQMLCHGHDKVVASGLQVPVTLKQGDAQNLGKSRLIGSGCSVGAEEAGIAESSIDKISMSFGIRNVPDRAAALREMRRVLKSEVTSRVCILEFSLPSGEAFLPRVARAFVEHVVPIIGSMATMGQGGMEYSYLTESILNFPAPLNFTKQMGAAGLRVTSITSFAYGAVQLYEAQPDSLWY